MKKQNFTSLAMKGGLTIGLALFIVHLIAILLKSELIGHKWPVTILTVGVMVFCLLAFGRRRAIAAGASGLRYGQAFGFMVLTMLFAGIVVGIGDVLAHKVIAPQYFEQVFERSIEEARQMLAMNPALTSNPDTMERALSVSRMMFSNPFMILLAGFFNTFVLGALLSLLLAILVKRPAAPLAEGDDNEAGS